MWSPSCHLVFQFYFEFCRSAGNVWNALPIRTNQFNRLTSVLTMQRQQNTNCAEITHGHIFVAAVWKNEKKKKSISRENFCIFYSKLKQKVSLCLLFFVDFGRFISFVSKINVHSRQIPPFGQQIDVAQLVFYGVSSTSDDTVSFFSRFIVLFFFCCCCCCYSWHSIARSLSFRSLTLVFRWHSIFFLFPLRFWIHFTTYSVIQLDLSLTLPR